MHAVLEGAAGGEEQDRGGFLVAQAAEDGPAVEAGEHDVEDDGVVVGLEGAVEALLAVGGGVDGVALFAEGVGEGGTEVGVVFDEEHFHERQPGAA